MWFVSVNAIFGRHLLDSNQSEDEDYEADAEEVTCSAPENLNNVFYDLALDNKLLVILKVSPALDFTQLIM